MARQKDSVRWFNNSELRGSENIHVHTSTQPGVPEQDAYGSDLDTAVSGDAFIVELPEDLLRPAARLAASSSETLEKFVLTAIEERLARLGSSPILSSQC